MYGGMSLMPMTALLLVCGVLLSITTVKSQLNDSAQGCILQYHDLEKSLLSSEENVDSLTETFFPPNEQTVVIVEVFYYINNSNIDVHPLTLERDGLNTTGLEEESSYRFRWSQTPIYLFMDPNILEALSLYSIRIIKHTARIVVDPICTNYYIDGIALLEYHLNQMTSLLRSYALRRESSLTDGIDDSSQGYSSYFNDSLSDFIVLGYDADYEGNMFLLIFSLIALAIFVTIATPLLISSQYETLYKLEKEVDSEYVFIVWGNATVCVFAVVLVVIIDIKFVVEEFLDGVPSAWPYYLTMAFVILLVLFDLGLAVAVKKLKDFPVPALMEIICFCTSSTIIAQTIAIWFAIMAAQLVTFHAAFIFLAFVASPVQTASTVLLYIASIFCGVSLATLFFATYQRRTQTQQKKTLIRFIFLRALYLVLFLCIITFVVLFATCFLRVTIYVGDTESGGIPAIFASLAPSALLGALGLLAKKIADKYKVGEKKGAVVNVELESPSTALVMDEAMPEMTPENQCKKGQSTASDTSSAV